MKTKRFLINLALIIGLLLTTCVLFITIINKEWNTVAGSLAVATAVIGSWSAQRIIWKQEDELDPEISISLDIKSRKSLTQFVIENVGGSAAYDVRIKWRKSLFNLKEEEVHFNSGKKGIDFHRIAKGQKFSILVNSTLELYKKYDDKNEPLDFYGEVFYKKKLNNKTETKEDFFVSLEPFRTSLDTVDEYQAFLHEGSKIHSDLIEINNSIKKLTNSLENKK